MIYDQHRLQVLDPVDWIGESKMGLQSVVGIWEKTTSVVFRELNQARSDVGFVVQYFSVSTEIRRNSCI